MEKSNEKNNPPLVSVIMITYNQENFIEDAIKSVVYQKASFPYELIIADDASTDKTPEIIESWAQRFPDKIRFLKREKNLGLQKNFLDAYSHARGKYLAICEGDDFWSSSKKLSRQVDFLEQNPDYSVCFHRVINFYTEDNSKSFSNPRQPKTMTLEDLAKGNTITNLSVMYRKIPFETLPSWLEGIKLFDYAFHSLHAEKGKIGYISKPMAVYRRHNKGIWSGDQLKAWELAMTVREKLMLHFKDSRPEAVKNYFQAYKNIVAALMAHYLEKGDKTEIEKLMNHVKSFCKESGLEFSEQELNDKAKTRLHSGTAKKSPVQATLTYLRTNISKLIPLPHIKPG